MALRGSWIAVDIIGTNQGKDIFVHSAGGAKVAKTLRRCALALGLDKRGEAVVRAVVEQTLQGRAVPEVDGLHVETHEVVASDGTPVGLLVWVGDQEPSARPIYNGWVMDMRAMTTRTSGDNPALIGDGRVADEERHIQYLFTYLNPDDVWYLIGAYSDVMAGEDGLFLEGHWSLRPAGQWVHFWSSGRVHLLDDEGGRLVYGLTLHIPEREIFESNIGALVRYSGATLLLVEARDKIPLTTAGRLAPLSENQVNQVLAQVDVDILSTSIDNPLEQKIEIDSTQFLASTFPLHSSRENHGDPVAIILLAPEESR